MVQYILFFCSVFIFFIIFYLLNCREIEPLTNRNEIVDPQSNLVDSVYLNQKNAKLLELQENLSNIRNILYKKKQAEILSIDVKQKQPDDKYPDQFNVTIDKKDDFHHILHINNPIGNMGIPGQPGKNGQKGDEGPQGDKGVVGHCGAIVN